VAARYAAAPEALRSVMFSTRLERLRQFKRLAVLVAATLLAVGIALIAVWAVRAFNMLGAAEADRAPIIIGVLMALAVPVVLCLIAYLSAGCRTLHIALTKVYRRRPRF
jgi:amino acid transporter